MSGGCLAGQNVVSSLQRQRNDIFLCALNSDPEETSLSNFDTVWLVPELRKEPGRFAKLFNRALEKLQPSLIIPCRDDDVLFLAERSEEVPELLSHALCGSSACARVMINKNASHVFSRRHSLPFAPTIDCKDDPVQIFEFAGEHGYPLVSKPAEGYASRGISFVMNERHLESHIGQSGTVLQAFLGKPEPLIQHVVDVEKHGVPLFQTFEAIKTSIQIFIQKTGIVEGTFVTENVMKQGRSEAVSTALSDDAMEIGKSCAEAFAGAGWRGPLNIQCQRNADGKLVIYEYNGRYTGATSARLLLGYDEVGMALRDYCPELAFDVCDQAVTDSVSRALVSRRATPSVVEDLKEKGVWHAQ